MKKKILNVDAEYYAYTAFQHPYSKLALYRLTFVSTYDISRYNHVGISRVCSSTGYLPYTLGDQIFVSLQYLL